MRRIGFAALSFLILQMSAAAAQLPPLTPGSGYWWGFVYVGSSTTQLACVTSTPASAAVCALDYFERQYGRTYGYGPVACQAYSAAQIQFNPSLTNHNFCSGALIIDFGFAQPYLGCYSTDPLCDVSSRVVRFTSGATTYNCSTGYIDWQGNCTTPHPDADPLPLDPIAGGKTTPGDGKIHGDDCDKGMCVANAHAMLASLSLSDTPIGYQPAVGPGVFFQLSYSHLGKDVAASANYSNVGAQWSHNFLTFIEEGSTTIGQKVKRVVGGGGYVLQTAFNTSNGEFAREKQGLALLKRIPASGAATSYTLSHPDGSVDTFSQIVGTSPKRFFLKTVTDPQGKSLTLNYDGSNRLTSIVDALNKSTTFSYENANPLLITKVTDPYGRQSVLTYTSGKLTRIKDVVNIESSFVYGTTDPKFISSMTTAYGTSTFATGAGTTAGDRWLELTDPLGHTERLETKTDAAGVADTPAAVPANMSVAASGFTKRNTFYWDKRVHGFESWRGDYAKAQRTHWLLNDENGTSGQPAMVKAANENPIYFNYPSQPAPDKEGTIDKPSAVGRLLSVSTSQVTSRQYNALGNTVAFTDPMLRQTIQTYDAATGIDPEVTQQKTGTSSYGTTAILGSYTLHRPQQYTDAAGKQWSASYNADGQPTLLTDPNSDYTQLIYDGSKRLEKVRNTTGADVRILTYDSFDRVLTSTDSEGYVLTYSYDAFDRVTQIAYPDGTTETFNYNFPISWQGTRADGTPYAGSPSLDLWIYTDRQGRQTFYTYDKSRRRTSVSETVTMPDGSSQLRTTSFSYYANGTLQSITDAAGSVTLWQRDEQSRPITKCYAWGISGVEKCEGYTYDLAGRLKTVTDPEGRVKTIGYNSDDTIASLTYTKPSGSTLPDTPNVSYLYDQWFRRPISMTDMSGNNGSGTAASATTTFSYTALGTNGALQLLQETSNGYYNQHVAYFYDALGRVSQRWAAETQEGFGYDGLGRLTSYNTPLGAFNFTYQGHTGRVTSRSVNGGTFLSQTYGYDTVANDRRLLTITANTAAARSYTLGYTIAGTSPAQTDRFNIRSIAESAGAGHPTGTQSWAYGYDQADRLLSAIGTGTGGTTSAGSFGWQLDKLDNATKISYPGYNDFPLYNQHNQQTKNAWWQSFTFDPSGNSTREYNENNITQRDYKWDFEGRLVEMGNGTGTYKVEFRYDGLGRRILQKTTDAGIVAYKRYQWCGMRQCQMRPATGTSRTRSYLLTGEYDFTASKKYVYFTDHQGNVRDLLDGTTGTRVGALDYTPYGTLRDSFGTLPHFRYAGLLWVPEMGLYASSTRFYDPGTTRWLSRDWIREGGGINLYAYVGGNPVMRIDPLGLDHRISGGISATGALVGVGGSVGVSVGISVPDNPLSFGDYQAFTTLQGAAMAGGGGFLGAGFQGSYAYADKPYSSGISTSTGWNAEVDVGWGESFGLSIQGDWLSDCESKKAKDNFIRILKGMNGATTGLPIAARWAIGAGVWMGAGPTGSITVATPTFGEIFKIFTPKLP